MTEITIEDRCQMIDDLVRTFYSMPNCSCGGPLHTLLDDLNVRDCDFVFSYQELQKPEWASVRGLGTLIIHELMKLDEPQRYAHFLYRDVALADNKDFVYNLTTFRYEMRK